MIPDTGIGISASSRLMHPWRQLSAETLPVLQVLLLKYRSGGRGLQKSLTDVALDHHEECACVCQDDPHWGSNPLHIHTHTQPHTHTHATAGPWDNELHPLLQRSASHTLPLEANKILLSSCCLLANWITRLESNKSSEWGCDGTAVEYQAPAQSAS